ncbi:MAG TPA: Zn-ribbon domain-containing OB-fold protein [Candidatus Kryptonia bacterium]|nr:Zn-ribbon domain-containing OB-fold protein [Candidatus Kryptonia bacterium]
MSDYLKPLPSPSPDSRPFWDAAKRHELQLPRCRDCAEFFFYPRHVCPRCLGERIEWRRVSGDGTVYSFTVVRRPPNRAFVDVPYVLAIVELAEGPRMTTNIVGCRPEDVRCNLPVTVVFEDVTPEVTLVKFKLVTGTRDR